MLKVLHALTCFKKDGFRTLFSANRGQHHYEKPSEAVRMLEAVKGNNSEETLKSLGVDPDTLRIDPIFCYDHGDALGVFPDENPVMDLETMKHLVAWINKTVPPDRRDVQPDFSAPKWSTNRAGTVSQAGMCHRMVDYVQNNEIQTKDLEWPTIAERVLELAREGKWSTKD